MIYICIELIYTEIFILNLNLDQTKKHLNYKIHGNYKIILIYACSQPGIGNLLILFLQNETVIFIRGQTRLVADF